MTRLLAILTMLVPGCVQTSPNARISVPISINVSVVPAVDAGGVR
jgi:hypothetical protein